MNPYLELLYAALATDLGLILSHENPRSAAAQLDQARRGEPALQEITILLLEDEPNRVYLCRPAALKRPKLEVLPPCPPNENQPAESTCRSLTLISSGSELPTETRSESRKQSGR